jgi:hypothetical protein
MIGGHECDGSGTADKSDVPQSRLYVKYAYSNAVILKKTNPFVSHRYL